MPCGVVYFYMEYVFLTGALVQYIFFDKFQSLLG